MNAADGAPTVFLDACVLYPDLVRGILLGVAERGMFRPRWSLRVLDEWQIATARQQGTDAEDRVAGVRTRMTRTFPGAEVTPDPGLEARILLPDPSDVHVAAAAMGSDFLLTFNTRDFPRGTLAGLGLEARHPDSFLWELWSGEPDAVRAAMEPAFAALGIVPEGWRGALKRARLSRLGKAVCAR